MTYREACKSMVSREICCSAGAGSRTQKGGSPRDFKSAGQLAPQIHHVLDQALTGWGVGCLAVNWTQKWGYVPQVVTQVFSVP